jgi:hypothetical protein
LRTVPSNEFAQEFDSKCLDLTDCYLQEYLANFKSSLFDHLGNTLTISGGLEFGFISWGRNRFLINPLSLHLTFWCCKETLSEGANKKQQEGNISSWGFLFSKTDIAIRKSLICR